jgi:mono/diheme cytochrome c family protein
MRALIRTTAIALVLVAILAAIAMVSVVWRGLSTRVPPTAAEAFLARSVRALATPRAVRAMPNPVELTPAVRDEAIAHFADHCASCHGNDGSGDTPLGRSLYPPAPDMRRGDTQALTDGELFAIIENGIRLTGMPAWGTGTPAGERQSWALVHFIRQLDTLTPEDLARMAALNPRSPEEVRQEDEIRRFLAGEDEPASPGAPGDHAGHR